MGILESPIAHRETTEYGNVTLSVIAGRGAYCSPRENLPSLADYRAVEIAIVQGDDFVTPGGIGLPEFDRLYDGDQVAGYVAVEDVAKLRAALAARAINPPQMPKPTPKAEITLAQLIEDYDWAQVFADESSGNVDKTVSVAPPTSPVSAEPMSRADVAEIIAAVNGDNDGPEWIGVFRLLDGRYLVASGSCDYTGWDCQAGNSLIVAGSLADAINFGLTDEERARLGLERI